jgi:hypothetical protein
MHRDQYGLEVTAASDAAADLYRQAVDAVLAAQHAAEPLLDQLLSVDPDSGVGRIARHACDSPRDGARKHASRLNVRLHWRPSCCRERSVISKHWQALFEVKAAWRWPRRKRICKRTPVMCWCLPRLQVSSV